MELRRYNFLLEPNNEAEEKSEMEVYTFLANRLGSETAADDAMAEADEKGSAIRLIEYPLGNTARVVISVAR
jgi:hypothetical protein